MDFVLRTRRGRALSDRLTDPRTDVHVPALCDVEAASALRAVEARGSAGSERVRQALRDYLDLPLVRYGHAPLVPRVFALRRNFSAYDAVYVALAEAVGGRLLSTDDRLVAAVRDHTDVDVASA